MKCFYHNDRDGEVSAAIVAFYTSNYNKADYRRVDYVQMPKIDDIGEVETVWFVDYSFTEPTMAVLKQLIDRGNDIIWIDHHGSSLKMIESHPEFADIRGIREVGKCGALLTYEYFRSHYVFDIDMPEPPHFLYLIDDYDCWKKAMLPESTHFQLGVETFSSHDALDDIWIVMFGSNHNPHNYVFYDTDRYDVVKILERGGLIKDYIDSNNAMQCRENAYESIIGGLNALVINRRSNSWIFGDRIDDYPIVCVYGYNGKKFVYSLFTTSKLVDCSKIAESYGGGGHKGAAGFTSKKLLFKPINLTSKYSKIVRLLTKFRHQ